MKWNHARRLAPSPLHIFVVGAVITGASGCTALQPEDPHEWFETGAGVFQQQRSGSNTIQDASGFSLNGGYDFNADRVRASLEMGLAWSEHEIVGDDVDHTLTRWSVGGRATSRLQEIPLGAYVRGGFFWRDDSAHDGLIAGDDFWGEYIGTGIEWWCTPAMTLGPFALFMRSGDGDFEESYIGITARFYIIY